MLLRAGMFYACIFPIDIQLFNVLTRGRRRQVGGVNVFVKGDCGPFFSVWGCQVGWLLAWQDDVPPGCHLIVQCEVTGTGRLESHFCLLANLQRQKDTTVVFWLFKGQYCSTAMYQRVWTQHKQLNTWWWWWHKTHHLQRDNTYPECSAGTLDLDVAPAWRVPAANWQVAGQVLVTHCLPIDRCHLGLSKYLI